MKTVCRILIGIIWYLSFVNCQLSFSQNLVYNPGFESDSMAVIESYSQLKAGNTLVDGWYVPTDGTSDYYNSRLSTIKGHPIPKARTGQGRAAMILSNAWQFPYREFITGRLIRPLEKDKKYKVTFYICRYKYAHYSPLQVGVYFTKDSLFQPNYYANIKVTPQVKIDDYTLLESDDYWQKVEGVFIANGGEKYLTIGNFKQTINDLTQPAIKVSSKFTIVGTRAYAYCFIDDASVEEYYEENISEDTKTKHYLYLVDCSSSMLKEDKWKKTVKGIQKSVKNLPADSYYSILGFNSECKILTPVTKSLLYDFTAVLDTIIPKGQTNAINAINSAYDFMESNSNYHTELIMCTDGQFKLDDSTFFRVIRSESNFNLLQIGGRRIPYLESLMNSSGGKYVVCQNKNVKEELMSLSSSVTNNLNEVEYTKAKAGKVLMKWTLLLCVMALVVFAV